MTDQNATRQTNQSTNYYTDFHSHLIPGVDDGARDTEFSLAGLAAFRREGVRQVITTPHFDGALTQQPEPLAARLAALDAGWETLRGIVAADTEKHGSAMRVERGVEVMLNVPDPDLSDPRLRLAGTKFVLVEFPMLQLPPANAVVAVQNIRQAGWVPVIAHPERYRNLESLAPLGQFLTAGALLQVNAGSLFGDYGSTAQKWAMDIFTNGLASYVASDYHARGEPGVARFGRALAEAGFANQATLLLSVNPGRLLAGDMPQPVPAMVSQAMSAAPWWKRMLGG